MSCWDRYGRVSIFLGQLFESTIRLGGFAIDLASVPKRYHFPVQTLRLPKRTARYSCYPNRNEDVQIVHLATAS